MKKIWWIIIIVVSAIALVGVLIFLRGNEDTWIKDQNGKWIRHGNPTINDFESCAKEYPVLETYPEQCKTNDGRSFTKGQS